MKRFTIIFLAVVVASSLLWRSDSHAGSLTLYLQNGSSPYNLEYDVHGTGWWQHSAGFVYADLNYTSPVATFKITRRADSIATMEPTVIPTITMTIIFWPGEDPPQNITLQGVQKADYYSEWGLLSFRGGVSAASARYSRMVGGSALCVDNLPLSAGVKAVLTIDYPGPSISALNLLLLD